MSFFIGFIMKILNKIVKRGRVSKPIIKSKIPVDPDNVECFINGHYLNINFSKHYEFEAHKIINKIYKLEAEKESKEACIYIASQLHFLNRDISGTHIVIHLFKNIEYRMLSSWSLIALLRSTYCFKSKIPDWESLFNYTKDYFEESGLDTKKELYGLDL